jgi:acyl carrier protein
MKVDNVESTLVRIIANYTDREAESIHRTADLREELGLSSFDLIALSTEIEESFTINIDNIDVLAEVDTFGYLVDLITKEVDKSPSN